VKSEVRGLVNCGPEIDRLLAVSQARPVISEKYLHIAVPEQGESALLSREACLGGLNDRRVLLTVISLRRMVSDDVCEGK
jgi:hypothetical protein